ncbi:alpha/beta hydrolase [Pseudohalocynthiibacter aestuariivivens]|nr:alpha/beta hydrolase [Pseudohalocynthiibacter aestuariivivens]QIE46447.1 alpha/beta hydrolase [Pseudohalocynthiibacter aestuariivivens]
MSDLLHICEIGTGAPVLVLHGARLDHRHMQDALEPTFKACSGWRRIYVDLPGCGRSMGFDRVASQDDVLTEILRVIDATCGTEPCAVIGESRGAYLAEGLAHSHAQRLSGVALIVPGGNSDASRATIPAPVTLRTDGTEIDALDLTLRARAKRLVVRTVPIVAKITQTKVPAAALHDAALEARVCERFEFSFHRDMQHRSFDRPSLIVAGRQDSIAGYCDALEMQDRFPRASFALLDCAGHAPGWERPDLFSALVRDWLNRLATE